MNLHFTTDIFMERLPIKRDIGNKVEVYYHCGRCNKDLVTFSVKCRLGYLAWSHYDFIYIIILMLNILIRIKASNTKLYGTSSTDWNISWDWNQFHVGSTTIWMQILLQNWFCFGWKWIRTNWMLLLQINRCSIGLKLTVLNLTGVGISNLEPIRSILKCIYFLMPRLLLFRPGCFLN